MQPLALHGKQPTQPTNQSPAAHLAPLPPRRAGALGRRLPAALVLVVLLLLALAAAAALAPSIAAQAELLDLGGDARGGARGARLPQQRRLGRRQLLLVQAVDLRPVPALHAPARQRLGVVHLLLLLARQLRQLPQVRGAVRGGLAGVRQRDQAHVGGRQGVDVAGRARKAHDCGGGGRGQRAGRGASARCVARLASTRSRSGSGMHACKHCQPARSQPSQAQSAPCVHTRLP